MPFSDDYAKRSVPTATKLRHGQTSSRYELLLLQLQPAGIQLPLELNDQHIGPSLDEVETGKRPEWKHIADRIPTHRSYWAQWKSLSVRNDILECHWESADVRSKMAQVVLPWNKVNDVLTELHAAPQEVTWVSSKTLNIVQQRYYWLQVRNDDEEWCRQCDICSASRGPRTRNQGQMHQYNVLAQFERLAIDVAGSFPQSDQESLRHSQPRGFDSGGSPGYKLFLPLQSIIRAA
jgi:hypothetical protein